MVYGGYNELVNGVYKPINITTGPHSVETYRYIWINYKKWNKFSSSKEQNFLFLEVPFFFKRSSKSPQPPNQAPQERHEDHGSIHYEQHL